MNELPWGCGWFQSVGAENLSVFWPFWVTKYAWKVGISTAAASTSKVKQQFHWAQNWLLNSCICYAGDMTGAYSIHTIYEGHEIMFHVSTLLPYSKDNKQQVSGGFLTRFHRAYRLNADRNSLLCRLLIFTHGRPVKCTHRRDLSTNHDFQAFK